MFPFNAYTDKDPDPIKLWQHLHGASSHFPIAMLFLACAFDFGALLFRKPAWRTVSFWMIIGAAVVSIPAILSGLTGLNGWFSFDKWMADHMIIHRNVALLVGAASIVMAIWRVARREHSAGPNGDIKTPMRGFELLLYLFLLLGTTLLAGYTGLLGAYVARGY